MKRSKQFIHLLFIIGLLFAIVIACDKSDDLNGDDQSAETIKDADGNVYKTVKIGSQVWMAENLKTTRYNDGNKIPNVTDNAEWAKLTTGAWCNYENLESNVTNYGRLYNWHAVNTAKLAPVGWHVPTEEDWTTLVNYVAANTGTSGSEAKALAAKINWFSSSDDGAIGNDLTKNNSTGFSALPGGHRISNEWNYDAGFFYDIGYKGSWWSSNVYESYARYLSLSSDGNMLHWPTYDKECGFSVRCVRNN